MKIIFFTNTILEHGGGLEKYFIETTHALLLRHPEDQITVVTFNEKRTETLQHLLSFYYWKKMPIENIYREKTEDILQKLGGVSYVKCDSFRMLRKVLTQADVIYSKNEIIDLAILKFFGGYGLPPIIAGIHTPLYFPIATSFHTKLHNVLYNSWLYRFLLRQVTAIHAINKSATEIIRRGRFLGEIFFIPNPFLGKSFRVIHHSGPEFRVLYAGRISREKGLDVVLGCIHNLLNSRVGENFRFQVAGTGDETYMKKLESLARTFPNRMTYLGYVPNERIHELYEWTDVVLAPSHFETMPYVIFEAGASGKLTLASDIPGPQDIILNEETGYLLPLSVDVFTEKLLAIAAAKARDTQYLSRLSSSIEGHIRDHFSPEIIYQQFRDMIQKVSGKPKKSL